MNTPKQNIEKVLKGKKVLFLENSNGLEDGLDILEEFFKEKNITHKMLYNLSELSFDTILAQIKESDCIVFQTRWMYKISQDLREYMMQSKDKKIVIESYISEPSFYYKPEGIVHDVYIVQTPLRNWRSETVDESKWKFFKLSDNAYWDYKNKFDK